MTVDIIYLLMALVAPIIAATVIEAIVAWAFKLHSQTWHRAGVVVLLLVAVLSVVGVAWLNHERNQEGDS